MQPVLVPRVLLQVAVATLQLLHVVIGNIALAASPGHLACIELPMSQRRDEPESRGHPSNSQRRHVAGCSPPGGRLFLCQLVHHELGLEGCFIRLDACRGRNEFARAMATLRILS